MGFDFLGGNMLLFKQIKDRTIVSIMQGLLALVYVSISIEFFRMKYDNVPGGNAFHAVGVYTLLAACSVSFPLYASAFKFCCRSLADKVSLLLTSIIIIILHIDLLLSLRAAGSKADIFLSFALCLMMLAPLAYFMEKAKEV